MNIKHAIAILAAFSLTNCATPVNFVVDPHSISDQSKYDKDYKDCTVISENYKGSDTAVLGSAAVGGTTAGLAATGVVAVATGGLIILPIFALAAVGGGGLVGGMVGGSNEQNKVNRSRENILVQCMNDRGYKAYSPNAK